MKKTKWSLLALLFSLLLVLAACNDDKEDKEKKGSSDEKEQAEELAFELAVENKGDAITGGTLKVGMTKDSPFQGIFSYELYEDAYDDELMKFASNSIFEVGADFRITDGGLASIEVDEKGKKVKVKIREGVKWSDGEPFTIEDVIYPYYIIADPEYTGVRYDTDRQNIVGLVEYHDGKADTISGIKKIDDYTVEISFKKLSPAIYYSGDGLWGYAAPKHQIEDIPVVDLVESDPVRKNPASLGAFVIDKVVPGESVKYVKNKNYFKGEAKLDSVIVEVVPSTSVAAAIKNGEYDLVLDFNQTKYTEIKDLENIDILGRQELYYSYLGFKVGKYDQKKAINITDLEGSKMGDAKLRQAMGYALDIEAVSEEFYHGLRVRANSLIPPVFEEWYNEDLKGYNYDPEKAKQILDEAGYKDVDGDGLRENPKGEKLEINLAAMEGDTTQEQVISYYLQNWKDVGLNVTLTTGRLIDFNSFYDKVQADDPKVDIFMAAWGTGTNPSPAGAYGAADEYNMSRYTSDALQSAVEAIDSEEAFDKEYRAEQFKNFQQHIEEMATTIPMQFRYEIIPVNKSVKSLSIDYASEFWDDLHEIELVSENPVK